MKRLFFFSILLVSALAFSPPPIGSFHQSVTTSQPNIVIILADDMGQGDVTAFNAASRIKTPNLDQLARQGLRFTDAHSGASLCTPTRYGLLTGRYCFRSALKRGVLQGYSSPLIDSGRTTLPSLIKHAGYTTACIGKWHLGLNWQRKDLKKPLVDADAQHPASSNADYTKPISGVQMAGFDYSFVLPASLDMPPYCFIRNGNMVNPTMRVIEGHDMQKREVFYRTGDISADLQMSSFLSTFINEAISFIDRHQQTPFLLYLPLTSPHTPWAIEERFRGHSAIGTYGDFVEQTDYYIGQVLASLAKNGLSQNTLVVFASDNGSYWTEEDIKTSQHQSNNGWRGMKSDIYEGGHRIPLLIRWPGHIEANSVTSATVCLTDLLATIAEVTQQAVPVHQAEDSYSLVPLFSQKTRRYYKRPYTIHHSGDGKFAIRDGDWKYISSLGSGGFSNPKTVIPKDGEATGQLYNLRNDPKEQTNLFFQHTQKVTELSRKLQAYEVIGKLPSSTENR